MVSVASGLDLITLIAALHDKKQVSREGGQPDSQIREAAQKRLKTVSCRRWAMLCTQSYTHMQCNVANLSDGHKSNAWGLRLPLLLVVCNNRGLCRPIGERLASVLVHNARLLQQTAAAC